MAKRITLTESTGSHATRFVAAPAHPRAQQNGHGGTEDTFDAVLLFTRYLVKRRRSIAAIMAVGVIAVVVWALMQPDVYRSYATILPTSQGSQLADLKSLAGIPVTEEDPSALYPVILNSQWMQNRVLQVPYSFYHDGQQIEMTLEQYFGLENPDHLRAAIAGITTVRADKRTGVIEISSETTYPGLSQAVLQRYIESLEDFNANHRASQARNSAKYLERQLAEREGTLHQAEDHLEEVQQANRGWMMSTDPELAKVLARMKLEIETQTQAYIYLRQQYEMAKFDAQKDMPIVRILDRPNRPETKSGPNRTLAVILAVFASAGVGVVFHLAGYAMHRRREQGEAESLDLLIQDVRMAIPLPARARREAVESPVERP